MGIFKNKNKSNSIYRQREASKSPKVFSYYTASHKQLSNYQRRTEALSNINDKFSFSKININKLFWYSIVFTTMVAFIYMSVLGKDPRVRTYGESVRLIVEYQAIAKKAASQDVKNRSKLLLQSAEIEAYLLEHLPEADHINVSSTIIGHEIETKITVATPFAVLSQVNGQKSDDYILSSRGKIVINTLNTSYQYTSLPIIYNNTNFRGKVGDQLFKPDEAESFVLLDKMFRNNTSNSVSYKLSLTPHEIAAQETGKAYFIKFILDGTIKEQYGAYRAAISKYEQLGQQPSQYVDARLAEKIYMK